MKKIVLTAILITAIFNGVVYAEDYVMTTKNINGKIVTTIMTDEDYTKLEAARVNFVKNHNTKAIILPEKEPTEKEKVINNVGNIIELLFMELQ